jgi:hypothetical protein
MTLPHATTVGKDQNVIPINGATETINKERHLDSIAIDALFNALTKEELTNNTNVDSNTCNLDNNLKQSTIKETHIDTLMSQHQCFLICKR